MEKGNVILSHNFKVSCNTPMDFNGKTFSLTSKTKLFIYKNLDSCHRMFDTIIVLTQSISINLSCHNHWKILTVPQTHNGIVVSNP